MHSSTVLVLIFAHTVLVLVGTRGASGSSGSSGRASASHRMDVYIAGFFPYGERVENGETGRGVMPSVKLALDHVNEHSTILRNYRLHMWWNDTECNAAVGMKSFFDMMHSGPHKLMLFGAACTHVTDPIAKASKHWHLTQLSYADTHPMFTKDAFPNFFRVVPSENAFNAPRLALLKEFNWTRIGTIYQNEPRYSLPHNHMVADLDALGLDVVETQSFVYDVEESLRKLREKDVRIIYGNFDAFWARRVFCEAFKLDMYGRSYQWLVMGGTYGHGWWAENDTDCAVEQVAAALESTILVDLLPLSTSGDITISGITADEYLTEYNSRRGSEYSRFHGYTYDGIWAVASAIQYVSQRKEHSLARFEYRVKQWEDIFLEALKNTSFEGVTGPVRFYNNERKASFLLEQFQNGQEVKIGEYNSLNGRLDLSLGHPLKWVGRSPPKDRTLRIIEHSQVNITIFVVLASTSSLGIVMATVFLAVNIKFRNQRYIKMSSPHLNNLIIIGCILTYLSVIFLGLDSGLSSVAAFPYICTARAWLLMAGFSLAFGAMFSKTWRVHSIFTDLKLNKKVIKDYQLFIVVGVLLAIDLAIMTTWQIADPFYRETKYIEPSEHPTLEDVIIVQENEYCQSNQMNIFIGVIYAYKGLLLIFGAFLAWETRHVSIPALNDSKHVGLSVYNCVIMCVMGAAIALVLSDRKDAVFILISLFIIFCTTATLFLVFVPKLVELKRNPSGVVDKKVRATLRPAGSKNRRDSSVCELEQRMRDVKQTNCRFRKVLMDKEAELQALIKRLGPEARAWIGLEASSSEPDINKESVKVQVKKDYASEGTDFTSIGSVGSSNDTLDSAGPESRKQKKTTVVLPGEEPPAKAAIALVASAHSASRSNLATAVSTMAVGAGAGLASIAAATSIPAAAGVASAVPPGSQPAVAAPPAAKTQATQSINVSSTSVPVDPTKPMFNDVRRESLTPGSKWSPGARQLHQQQQQTQTVDHHRLYEDERSNGPTTTTAKFSTQANCSSTTSITHSTTELNQLCHHSKATSKSRGDMSSDGSRRVSVQMTSSLKGNFVVSQSDLWDTHTLSHAKQHQRQSPRSHQSANRCPDHGHLGQQPPPPQQPPQPQAPQQQQQQQYEYDNSATTSPGPIQRSVSEKNRSKHRHKQQHKSTACQSETDSEREQRDYPHFSASSMCSTAASSTATVSAVGAGTTGAAAGAVAAAGTNAGPYVTPTKSTSRRLTKSQHSHHHSSPNVAPGGAVVGGTIDRKHRSTGSDSRGAADGSAAHHGTSGRHRKKEGSASKPNLYGACSESELLDGETAILPIFRKLLNEKESRYRARNVVGASCPNISIKCDIVEYL